MRSFWENHVNQVAGSRRDSGAAKGAASPSAGPGGPCGRRFRRSQSASAGRRPGGLGTGRLRKGLTRQQRMMEDSSALLEELTARVRGVVPEDAAAALRGGRSSGSDSEATTEPERDEREEEDEEVALLRAYNESSNALWRMHRQTIRLLLEHLDRLGLASSDTAAATAAVAPPLGCSTPVHHRGGRAASGSPAVSRVVPPVAPAEPRAVEEPAGEPGLGA
mmetsp:Transcript_105619/g.308871  ORF Transcript_105619/g.308871 Transcript_105619/m.308871 type:complete len:221 (-) Transcript_105619:47-709(-)